MTGNLAIILIPPESLASLGGGIPGSGGFTLTVYRVVPTLGEWGALATYAGLAYRDQLVLPDISGGWGLYFVFGNVATNGAILVGVAELA
jgi:hypothetical protein